MTSIAEESVRTTTADEAPAPADHVNGAEANGVLLSDAAADLSTTTAESGASEAGEPFVRVVKGSPTDEELAALVTVLAAAAASTAATPGSSLPPETWGDPVRMHRVAAPFSPYSFAQIGSHRL